MNKKLIIGLGGLLVLVGGVFAYTQFSGSNAKQINLPYGKNRGVEGEITSFNPTQADSTQNSIALHNEIAELMALNDKNELVPYAAKSVEMSKDSKQVKVTLKDGLKYEDGKEVKAQDYLNGIKLLAMPSSKSSYAMWATDWIVGGQDFAQNKSQTISGFKTLNDKEFTIDLTSSRAYFKTTFASEMFTPIPQHFIDKIGGLKNYGKDYKSFLSSGPLKIQKYQSGIELKLVKNDKTSLSKDIKVENIKFTPINTYQSAIMQFKQKKIYAIEKTVQADKILNLNKKADQIYAAPQMEYITVNRKSIDKNLAKAIYLSLDKNYINKTFFDSMNIVRNVITPNVYDNVENALKEKGIKTSDNEFNLKEAKELAKDFAGKKLTILLKSEKQQQNQYASYTKYVKTQLEKLGLSIEFKTLPSKNANNEIYKSVNEERNYDLALNAWSNDYPEASTFVNAILGEKTDTNFSAWTSKVYDENTQKAMQTVDTTQAGKLYANAVIEAKNEYAILPILQYNSNVYTQDGKLSPYNATGIRFVNYW